MEQGYCEGAIQQKPDLPGERQAVPNSFALDHAAQPAFESLFVGSSHFHGGVTGHMREFSRRAEETASFPLRVTGGRSEIDEDAAHLLSESTLRLVEPALKKHEVRLITAVEIGCDKVVFAAKVIVECALCNARSRSNGIHAYATDTLGVKQLARGGDYALLRWD